MITYNICFMTRGSHILLLNREKPSWMGCWNGIGGKVEQGELPRASMIREIAEETGIADYVLTFKGLVTWIVDGASFGGMYLYVAEVPNAVHYETPIRSDEGILDWKHLDWITHAQNLGIATNIPTCLPYALGDSACYDHHCQYEQGQLVDINSLLVEARIELDEAYRKRYLSKYI
ncbi:NUDIX domain-containing protein [Paenibacillus sp. SYP-B3998]|uniref:NUDIX domain-containing protein n=1 Tax=Paenibacillus sp. SYP-B3998 TaxID=2678564 RepID=A0A6G3ZWY4_9BACL|nr:NUDIX domain-containing protein [Paenibacillus sp. SYP-B3998]